MDGRRFLVAGWFSFLHGEATAGDLDALATVRRWLGRAGVAHDVAWSPAFGGPEAGTVDPAGYTGLVFACGPLGGEPVASLARRFAGRRRVAVGVSVVDTATAALFDVVLARDGLGPGWPDLALDGGCGPEATAPGSGDRWPVLALVTVGDQPEYGDRGRHAAVHRALRSHLDRAEVAVVEVDTRVDPRAPRQRSPAQVRGLLGAADAVVTTRLHGMVLGLRSGTPALAVDPIDGGAKVCRQAATLGWPAAVTPASCTEPALDRWLGFCLGPTAADAVTRTLERAALGLAGLADRFLGSLGS